MSGSTSLVPPATVNPTQRRSAALMLQVPIQGDATSAPQGSGARRSLLSTTWAEVWLQEYGKTPCNANKERSSGKLRDRLVRPVHVLKTSPIASVTAPGPHFHSSASRS